LYPGWRNRGASPAKANTTQAGLNSTHSALDEKADLESMLVCQLQDEVVRLRLATRQVFYLAAGKASLEETIGLLGSLGSTATRLAGLLKVQKSVTGGDKGMMAAISITLAELKDEMRLD
jgi:hypothetical protein